MPFVTPPVLLHLLGIIYPNDCSFESKKIYLLSHSQPEAPEDLNTYLKNRSIVYLLTVLVALCIVGLLFLCVSLLVSILLEELHIQNKDLAVLMFHCCTSLWRFFFFIFSLHFHFLKKSIVVEDFILLFKKLHVPAIRGITYLSTLSVSSLLQFLLISGPFRNY